MLANWNRRILDRDRRSLYGYDTILTNLSLGREIKKQGLSPMLLRHYLAWSYLYKQIHEKKLNRLKKRGCHVDGPYVMLVCGILKIVLSVEDLSIVIILRPNAASISISRDPCEVNFDKLDIPKSLQWMDIILHRYEGDR